MKLYYMRDNHLFRRLPLDVESAIEVIRDEFHKGYTYGMLCSDGGRPSTPMVIDQDAHARASFAEFEPRARRWLAAELAYKSPGDLEYESWHSAGNCGVPVHTDHPLRHHDRTCPACNPDGVSPSARQTHDGADAKENNSD